MPVTFITERDARQEGVEKEELYFTKLGYEDDCILYGG